MVRTLIRIKEETSGRGRSTRPVDAEPLPDYFIMLSRRFVARARIASVR